LKYNNRLRLKAEGTNMKIKKYCVFFFLKNQYNKWQKLKNIYRKFLKAYSFAHFTGSWVAPKTKIIMVFFSVLTSDKDLE
jgi:hypothetical protein